VKPPVNGLQFEWFGEKKNGMSRGKLSSGDSIPEQMKRLPFLLTISLIMVLGVFHPLICLFSQTPAEKNFWSSWNPESDFPQNSISRCHLFEQCQLQNQ
jgi:hypothetical protein